MSGGRITPWIVAATLIGVAAWQAARLLGEGPLRQEAGAVGALAALIVVALRTVRLRAPTDTASRRAALFSRTSRRVALAVFAVATAAAAVAAARQGVDGYPPLVPGELIAGETRPGRFHTAVGRPLHEALYTIRGPEGVRFLAPLDTFEGRLLVITTDRPPSDPVRVTGRLRDDIRTVQKRPPDSEHEEGPFMALYRDHMGLPSETRIYFLDTNARAGLNARALALVAAPAYLFLLVLGAPTRPGRATAPPTSSDPRSSFMDGPVADQSPPPTSPASGRG